MQITIQYDFRNIELFIYKTGRSGNETMAFEKKNKIKETTTRQRSQMSSVWYQF